MIWIIIFLGIIAISDVIATIIQLKNHSDQKAIELLTKQLQQERDQFARYKEQFDKELSTYKDARDLWAKKYYELANAKDIKNKLNND